MRVALLFSGQGNQQASHLERLRREAEPALQAALEAAIPEAWQASDASDAVLQSNRVAQPLIYALQIHQWSALRGALPRPVCVAGYSLGEVAACAAAGLFPPVLGVALCRERARLMDGCVAAPAGMIAINGLGVDAVDALAEAHGLAIAIRNGSAQFVLAGLAAGLAGAEAAARAAGAARVVRLAVSTPSHTPLLDAASRQFRGVLDALAGDPLQGCVLSAIDGRAANDSATARAALATQISTPLDWARCLDAVAERQPDAVLEIGPGTALARMWNERASPVPARACDEFRSSAGVLHWLQGQAGR